MLRKAFILLALLSAPAMAATHSFTTSPDLGALVKQPEITPCSPAEDLAYLDLCNRFGTESGAARCLRAGKGRYFDQCALDLCGRFTTENGAINCLETTADRHYLVEEVQLCNRTTTETGALECLRSAGEPTEGSNQEEIRRRLERALDYLHERRYERVRFELEDLIDLLDRSAH